MVKGGNAVLPSIAACARRVAMKTGEARGGWRKHAMWKEVAKLLLKIWVYLESAL